MKSVKYRRMKNKLNYNLSRIHIFKYIILIFLIVTLIFTLNIYNNVFKPQLKQLAENKAYYLCNIAVNEGVADVLYKNQISYEDLATFLKNSDGEITGIMTNLIAVNRLKTEFTVTINNKIQNIEKAEIYIPMGNLSGIELFSGLGPKIHIYLIPTSVTLIDFKNSFAEAGINQTRHEIFLEVKSIINILMPNKLTAKTEVVSKIPLVESIIVGKVPDTLTRVETEYENLREDIMNLQ